MNYPDEDIFTSDSYPIADFPLIEFEIPDFNQLKPLDETELLSYCAKPEPSSEGNDKCFELLTSQTPEINPFNTNEPENKLFMLDTELLPDNYESLPCPAAPTVSCSPVSITIQGFQGLASASNLIPQTVESSISEQQTLPSSTKNTKDAQNPKARKPRTRKTEPKKKLYEIQTPFEDKEMEQKRLNAIKAHRNRQKNDQKSGKLKEENNKLKDILAERNGLIQAQDKIIKELKAKVNQYHTHIGNIKLSIDSLVSNKSFNL